MYRRGIANKMDGVNYRSLLEAKWARFFYYLGWDAQYEPFELDGWIPDFGISFGRFEILFEIKPSMNSVSLLSDTVKAQKNAGEFGVAVCGFSPWIHDNRLHSVSGYFYNEYVEDEPFHILPCMKCGRYALTYATATYTWGPGRDDEEIPVIAQLCKTGDCDVFHLLDDWRNRKQPGSASFSLNSLWKEACNDVQWRSVAKRVRL